MAGCAPPGGPVVLLAGALLVATLVPAVSGSAGLAAAPAAAAALPLAGRVVAIDPGHQLGNSRYPAQVNRQVWVGLWKPCNSTGTATNGGLPGGDLHLAASPGGCKARLEALGATVRMTRTTNSRYAWGPCVGTRGRFGAKVGADLEVSLHGDGAASSTHGFFVIRPVCAPATPTTSPAGRERLAGRVRAGLVAAGFGVSTAYGGDGLDTRRDLGTLNMADVPTVMVELGNMRNAGDARCMTSATCRDRYAKGLAGGVVAYLSAR